MLRAGLVVVLAVCACGRDGTSDAPTDATTDALPADAQTLAEPCTGVLGFPGLPMPPKSFGFSVTTGRFNADANVDIAIGLTGGYTKVLAGRGTGLFDDPVIVLANTQASYFEVSAGDLDANGFDDIVSYRINTPTVAVSWSDGTSFQTTTQNLGMNAFALALGDVNNDGIQDLVAAGTTLAGTTNVIAIALGSASGLGTPTQFALGPYMCCAGYPLTLADLDGDGARDVVVGGSNVVYTARNDGTGAFTNPQSYALPEVGPRRVGAMDVDHDGHLDVLATTYNATDRLAVLTNDGTGKLTAFQGTQINSEGAAVGLLVRDIDGDGLEDALVAYSINRNRGGVVAFHGTNSGGLSAPEQLFLGGISDFAVADVTGDAQLDLLVENADGMRILRKVGTTFEGKIDRVDGSQGAAVADLDGDGHPEVIAARPNDVIVYGGAAPMTFPVTAAPIMLAPGDVNHDGATDLVAAGGGGLASLVNNGTGSLASAPVTSASSPRAIVVGDVNEDGYADVVFSSLLDNRVVLYRGAGDGTFESAVVIRDGVAAGIALADIDEDGHLDLLATKETPDTPYLELLRGHGDGTFTATASVQTPYGIGALLATDLNNDHHIDIVMRAVRTGHVWTGDGAGSFIPKPNVDLGDATVTSPPAVADLNGDSRLDIVFPNNAARTFEVSLALPDGTFSAVATYDSARMMSLDIIDLDHDGRPDIVTSGNLETVEHPNRCLGTL